MFKKGVVGKLFGLVAGVMGMAQAGSSTVVDTPYEYEPMFKDQFGGYGQSVAGIPWKGGRLRPNRDFKKHTNRLKCAASARRKRKRNA